MGGMQQARMATTLLLLIRLIRPHRNKTRRHQKCDETNANHPVVHGNILSSKLSPTITAKTRKSAHKTDRARYFRSAIPKITRSVVSSTSDPKINLKFVACFLAPQNMVSSLHLQPLTHHKFATKTPPQKRAIFPNPLKNTAKPFIPRPSKKNQKTVT
jgi:hypothetical protein